MENNNYEELIQIIKRFAKSGWYLIDIPAAAWLEGKGDIHTLFSAIEEADKQCGSCGCELDPLYKRALELIRLL